MNDTNAERGAETTPPEAGPAQAEPPSATPSQWSRR